MDAKLQRRIQRYGWDAAAKVYEAAWRENVAPAHAAMFARAELRRGEKVLDVACGSGLVTFRAAEIVGHEGLVTAIDISEEMARLVYEQAQRIGKANVQAKRMDADAMDLPDEAYDVALCALGLMFVPVPEQSVKEIFRILRPGGRIVVAVWGERKNCGWAEIFPIVDSVVQSEVCPLFFSLGTGNSLIMTLESVGFAQVEALRFRVTVDYANKGDALTAMIDGGAVALAARRFDATTRRDVEDRFLHSIAAFRRDDGGYAIPGEFVVAAGRKPESGDRAGCQ
jgi:ubiquinone/menaquinone biosynthesis C-methylase UbiE